MEISTLRENEQFCHSEEINPTPTNLPTPRNRSVSRSSSNSEEKGLTNQKRRDSTGASGKGSDPVGVRDRRNSIGKRSQASQSGSSIGQASNGQSGSYQGPVKGHIARRFGDRKSRAATGRGLPKKLGGGGAFTWGRPGCEMDTTVEGGEIDPLNDPDIVFDSVSYEPNDEEICSGLDVAIREFFHHASDADLLEYCITLNLQKKKLLVVERLVETGLEAKKEYRELISKALLYLFEQEYLTQNDLACGFCNIIDRADELILDTPDIVNILGKFIARAYCEKILPQKFIEIEIKNASSELIYQVMITSYGFQKDQIAIRTCWGEAGGFLDTTKLSEKIREILKEFLSTSDSGEVARCIRELDVPHYHHEIVYEGILIALENYQNEMVANSMVWLLQYLYTKECIISADQMVSGHERIYSNLDDISLDIPHAYTILPKIVQKSAQKKLITDRLKLQCPNKSRKRFSSESDVTHEIHDNQLPPSRDRLCSTGLCSSGLDSLPEIEDLKIEEEA